jgi:hypothetical protein
MALKATRVTGPHSPPWQRHEKTKRGSPFAETAQGKPDPIRLRCQPTTAGAGL